MRTRFHTYSYSRDDLDDLIAQAADAFTVAPSWEAFIRDMRGKGDFHPGVKDIPHPAAHLLHQYQRSGAPVEMKTKPWSSEKIASALRRGPHKSAKGGIEFLREEFCDLLRKQQWTLLPVSMIQHLPGLRLSPIDLVPQ